MLVLYFGLFMIVFSSMGQFSSDSLNLWVESQPDSPPDSLNLYYNAQLSLTIAGRERNEPGFIEANLNLARYHDQYGQLDSAIYYFTVLKDIYQKTGNNIATAEVCLELKGLFSSMAAYEKSLEQVFEALAIYEKENDQKGIALCYTHICDLLYYEDKYKESADYCDKAIAIQEQIDARTDLAVSLRNKASSLLFVEGALEEALKTINRAIDIYRELGEDGTPLLASINGRGNILKYMKRYDEAIADYQYVYDRCLEMGLERHLIPSFANIGHVYLMQKKYEKALPFILGTIDMIKKSGDTKNLWENYMHASNIYKEIGDYENAFEYNLLYSDEYAKYLNTIIERLESEKQIKYETAKKNEMISVQENKIKSQRMIQILYAIIAGLLLASLIGMYRSRKKIRIKQKEIEKSRQELLESLKNLKATQAQLIHAEKMASLGELTAGIAHEIQNPLNFVNNFSEISNELVEEIKSERIKDKGERDEELEGEILNDISQNLEKINHHGKRAADIVKGMLQHSRTSSGQKEPTDINALADEYLRLAYHGLRAKDKSFNADFKTDFDPNLPKINVIPQDIGRVLLNLINNAFYAVNARKLAAVGTTHALSLQPPTSYKPSVTVSTRNLGDQIEISVKDNGNGIPEEIKNKIFQPFFTTKPTGKGTGLGLSLAYDIVKAHSGELMVESYEGEGTEFSIQIPIS